MMLMTTAPSSVITMMMGMVIAPLETVTPSEIAVIQTEIIVICLATNAGTKLPCLSS